MSEWTDEEAEVDGRTFQAIIYVGSFISEEALEDQEDVESVKCPRSDNYSGASETKKAHRDSNAEQAPVIQQSGPPSNATAGGKVMQDMHLTSQSLTLKAL